MVADPLSSTFFIKVITCIERALTPVTVVVIFWVLFSMLPLKVTVMVLSSDLTAK